jgi:hypothetical protein
VLKPIWWVAFILLQAVFIVAGLALIFWTMNTWEENHKLDALFGAGIGVYAFLFAWRTARKWAREHISVLLKSAPAEQADSYEPPAVPS